MKKLICLLLCLGMLVSVTACHVTVETQPAAAQSESAASADDRPVSQGDKTVAAGETWTLTENVSVGQLELEDGAVVESEYPVIVFFEQSDTVTNGQQIGQVQFVSEYDEVVAVVHTNDTHGFIAIEPYVKGYADSLKESGKYSLVLTLNAGDQYSGGYAAAHVYDAEYIPAIMAEVYDYMTWGNNDGGEPGGGIQTVLCAALGDALGMPTLVANQDAAVEIDLAAYCESYEPTIGKEDFVALYSDILSLNEDGSIDWSALDMDKYTWAVGDNAMDDTAMVETANGTLIGLFGESTQGGSLTDEYFSGGYSTITVAQECADALRADGAQVVIMLTHTGWFSPDSTETSSNDTNSAQVALKTTGIDAIVDAHTHSIINGGEGYLFDNGTIVNQANCKGEAIGLMELYLCDGEVVAMDCDNFTADEYETMVEPDEEVQALVDLCFDRLAADGYTTVYAETDYFLNGERLSSADVGGGVRANETNLGDLVADGILYTAQKVWEGDPIEIALYPGFWCRSSVAAGEITKIDALSVFANPLIIFYKSFTAEGLVSELTSAISKIGEENNELKQVAGLTLTYDAATKAIVTLTVGDTVIYDNGEYLVGDDWSVGCAYCKAGGNDEPDEDLWIVPDNATMAQYWCEFLRDAEYTIYPDEIGAGGRITAVGEAAASAANSASGEAS